MQIVPILMKTYKKGLLMSELDNEFLDIFLDEAEDLLETWEQACNALAKSPSKDRIDELFRVAHNLKGSSASVGLVEFSNFVHKVEDCITLVKNDDYPVNDNFLSIISDCLEVYTGWIKELREDAFHVVDTGSILARLPDTNGVVVKDATDDGGLVLFGEEGQGPKKQGLEAEKADAGLVLFDKEDASSSPKEPSEEEEEPKTLGEILVEQGITSEEAIARAVAIQNRKIGQVLVHEGAATEEQVAKALEKQRRPKQDESLRISASKLDELMRIIGELATQQNIVHHCVKNADEQSELFKKAVNLCTKAVRQVQTFSMSLRMQPVSKLFQRMERIMRDTGRKQGKEIEVVLQGDDVELDKSVLEKMKDPLVHLVRNAVDHGLEDNAEREKIGKPSQGKILLKAVQESNSIRIYVKDDGKGMDPEAIRSKAVKKGLISADAKLSEKEIFELILLPNFSTREVVTDVSGRGVGMNVVKDTVDKLGGKMSISSGLGHGSEFEISLPTNLSIIDGMLIQVGENPYIVPILDLQEIIDLSQYQVEKTLDEKMVVNLRDRILPITDLAQYLNMERTGNLSVENVRESLQDKVDSPEAADYTIDKVLALQEDSTLNIGLVVNKGGDSIVLGVDRVLGQQPVVVRPLSDKMRDIPFFAGVSILGTGDPAMILSVESLTHSNSSN